MHCALTPCFVAPFSVASQAGGPRGLVRVTGKVPVWGNFTVTGCPGCSPVRCSPLMEGGAPDSGFARNPQLTGLLVGPYQLFRCWSIWGSWESCPGVWFKALFQEAIRSFYDSIGLGVWDVEYPLNSFLFGLFLYLLTGEMWAIITLDGIRSRQIWEPQWESPYCALPFGIWLPCTARDSSYTCEDGSCPAEGLSGPMESICHVDHRALPLLIWRGGALAGCSNCNFSLYWGHSVRTVAQVFLFRGQLLLCAAKQSASLPVCPNFWWYHSPNQYHAWFEESLTSISLLLVNSSTFQFRFVAGLLSLA